MPRQQLCKICQDSHYWEIETEIRQLIDERGTSRGVATEMARRHPEHGKFKDKWLTHIKKHFVYEKAVKAIDEDEVLDAFIEKGYNELTQTDTIPLNQLLSAISIKTKRAEAKAKQDMTKAMITAFISGARKSAAIDGEGNIDTTKLKEIDANRAANNNSK